MCWDRAYFYFTCSKYCKAGNNSFLFFIRSTHKIQFNSLNSINNIGIHIPLYFSKISSSSSSSSWNYPLSLLHYLLLLLSSRLLRLLLLVGSVEASTRHKLVALYTTTANPPVRRGGIVVGLIFGIFLVLVAMNNDHNENKNNDNIGYWKLWVILLDGVPMQISQGLCWSRWWVVVWIIRLDPWK